MFEYHKKEEREGEEREGGGREDDNRINSGKELQIFERLAIKLPLYTHAMPRRVRLVNERLLNLSKFHQVTGIKTNMIDSFPTH